MAEVSMGFSSKRAAKTYVKYPIESFLNMLGEKRNSSMPLYFMVGANAGGNAKCSSCQADLLAFPNRLPSRKFRRTNPVPGKITSMQTK